MNKKLSTLLLATTILAAAGAAQPAHADHWHGGGYGYGGGWHAYDYGHWRNGGWYNGWHDGRMGWWWTVDGAYYYYPQPVYPYPDPYTPSEVVTEVVQPTPENAQPNYVYYCASPSGYYPYIPHCTVQWQKMPPNAAQAAPPVPISRPAPVVVGDQRAIDAQHLAGYQAELQNIDMTSSHARSRLKTLEKHVQEFRETLYQRSYNAMDLLHQSEMLMHTIAEQREELAHPGSVPPQTPPMAQPGVMQPGPQPGQPQYGAPPEPGMPPQQ